MACVLSRFSLATATTILELKNSSKNENTVKSTAFWLSVWKKWFLGKRIAKESKMKDANLERSSIAKVSGHRNIQSSDDYDEADEDEQQQLSWTISERNSTTKPMPVVSITSGPCTSSAVIPLMMSSQAQNLMNAFTNMNAFTKCTFNLNSKTSPVIKPRKRRLHFIESDSDTD